ncbi:snRNA-activating protein complex subunit 3-like [Tubulanus polymorphus]|uniref:snRNA-activating protein complex subunit 3-like n=1 Tax=Tubulanus polymorphus TaxID=672921 RepID=UPI003DA60C11
MEDDNLINLEEFLDKWVAEIPESYFVRRMQDIEEAVLCEKMQQPPEVIKELAAVCDPSTLQITEEPVTEYEALCNVPKDTNLASIRMLKKKTGNHRCWDSMITDFSEKFYKPVPDAENAEKTDRIETQAVNLLLTVHIYDPVAAYSKSKPKVNQEIRVLGSQRLSELRDVITCASDYVIAGDFSQCPKQVPDIRAKDLYRSGFFFIENTFYNDMRSMDSRDYSECIINWTKSPDINVGPFTKKDMEESLFIDLSIRLNHPYIYQHQGNCEHVIMFTNVRVIHEDDGPIERYPLLIRKRRRKRVLCRGCTRSNAKWTVRGSPFSTFDPSHFCDECFIMLHYNTDGEKLGDFKAYAFVNNALL